MSRMFGGYRSRYCRLARACQATEPEDARRVNAIRPAVYILEKVDTGIGKTDRIVLALIRVVRRVRGEGQGLKYIILRCLR